jgi:hypothetical protein
MSALSNRRRVAAVQTHARSFGAEGYKLGHYLAFAQLLKVPYLSVTVKRFLGLPEVEPGLL